MYVAWRNFAGTMKVERRTLIIVLASTSYIRVTKKVERHQGILSERPAGL